MTTSIVAAALGDCFAQRMSRPLNSDDWKYDWGRTARLCAFNGFMGCFGHFYYGAMDAKVMPHAAKSPAAVISKVAIDQLLLAPICTAFFYLYKCVSEGRPSEFPKELQTKYFPTLVAGWQLWPAAHVINFAFVPTQQRILYANVVSVAGNYILSRAAAGDYSSADKAAAKTTKKAGRRKGAPVEQPEERERREILLEMSVKID